jgi:hypothetical protein
MLSIKFVEMNLKDLLFENIFVLIDIKPTWLEWSPWGNCSRTCDGGERIRYRTCKNDTSQCKQQLKCDGSDKQIQPCNTEKCRKSKNRGKKKMKII